MSLKCLKSEGCEKALRVICAVITRVVFSLHCFVTFGRIAYPPEGWDQGWIDMYWLLLIGLVGLLVEAVITLYRRKGEEYKWFCPSVFFYLLTIVPCVWIMEIGMLNYRVNSSTNSRAKFYNIFRTIIEAFNEDKVRCNRLLIKTILAIWSASLLQFTLVLTVSKAKKIRPGFSGPQESKRCNCCTDKCSCCGTEVFGIVTSMVLQDGPFLALRVLLLVKYEVISHMHIFFTVKNSLVLMLMCYRLMVLGVACKQNGNEHLQELEIEISSDGKELHVEECNKNDTSTSETSNAVIQTIDDGIKEAPGLFTAPPVTSNVLGASCDPEQN